MEYTCVARILNVSGWYSSSNKSGYLSLILIPRLYNSSSPRWISSPPFSLPFQGDCQPHNQDGIFCKPNPFSPAILLVSFRRLSKRIANRSNSLIRFFVGERVPCLACQSKLSEFNSPAPQSEEIETVKHVPDIIFMQKDNFKERKQQITSNLKEGNTEYSAEINFTAAASMLKEEWTIIRTN